MADVRSLSGWDRASGNPSTGGSAMNSKLQGALGRVVAIALAGSLGVGVQAGTAAAGLRTRTIAVDAPYTEPGGSVDGATYRGLTAVEPDCRFYYVGDTDF